MNETPQNQVPNSTAVGSIQEVQNLYFYGVKVGLLQSNDRFDSYLKNMKTKYSQISLIGNSGWEMVPQGDDVHSVSEAETRC